LWSVNDKTVLNFFKNSQRYLLLKGDHQICCNRWQAREILNSKNLLHTDTLTSKQTYTQAYTRTYRQTYR
jgi:hypothetical protein